MNNSAMKFWYLETCNGSFFKKVINTTLDRVTDNNTIEFVVERSDNVIADYIDLLCNSLKTGTKATVLLFLCLLLTSCDGTILVWHADTIIGLAIFAVIAIVAIAIILWNLIVDAWYRIKNRNRK
ncbi:MAG TPA: hypothetical protein PLZ52_12180 [Bacteroidales bacterium]|nr:hypothetical protein [Bacteroidales bacterium]HQL70149.1 hypothetical protein [Bacteroidales bacterium]